MSEYDDDPGRAERDRRQRELDIAVWEEKTLKLRSDRRPRWEHLRQSLEQEGIAPEDAVICRMHDEDAKLEFGIIAARDGRAFGFELDFYRYPDGRDVPSYEDAWVFAWAPLDEDRRTLYAYNLEVARELFARENAKDR